MKLRVRLGKCTSRLELDGDAPTLADLAIRIKEITLPSCGLSPETEFDLSLNGSEPLVDSGQSLSSCGIVSGDLICVILAQVGKPAPSVGSSSSDTSPTRQCEEQPPVAELPSEAEVLQNDLLANMLGTAGSIMVRAATFGPTSGCSTLEQVNNLTVDNEESDSDHGSTVVSEFSACNCGNNNTADKELSGGDIIWAGLCLLGQAGTSSGHVQIEEEDTSDLGLFNPEPMLCSEAEEGKVPHSLDVLYHRAQGRGPCDSIMVAAHCLMLETGFVPLGSEGRPGEMPPGWRAEGGVYRLQYSHVLCEHGLTVIVAVPMGIMLVINATMKINETVENAQKLLLKPSTYVTDKWAGESAAVAYRDLKKLSRIFKDQLVYPLIATARQAMNLPAVFGPTALPPELLLRVLRLLDVASVVALSAVNRDLHIATADPSLWRHLYHRDFRDLTSRPRDTDWKDLYKKKYKQQKEKRLFRHPRLFHPVPPQPLPFSPFPYSPNPIYPPGIIGGEYDQRPGIPYSLLPHPRFDPVGPQPGPDPGLASSMGRRSPRPSSNRASDIRRGFI